MGSEMCIRDSAIGDGAAADAAAMQEDLAAEEEVPEMGAIMMNNREVQEGADGRMYYVDDNTPAETISMGMYRGGTVQAFRNGGMASIADLARHYGMRR
mgnify:CR=1 FL=1